MDSSIFLSPVIALIIWSFAGFGWFYIWTNFPPLQARQNWRPTQPKITEWGLESRKLPLKVEAASA